MAEISGANLIGSNVVYDTRQPVNYFLKNIERQTAQRAAEQKALQDEMAKVKIDGVREPDRGEYIQKYNDWKDTFRSMTGTKDPAEKAQKKLEFDKKRLELEELVNDSKALGRGEQEFSKILLGNGRDNYSDDAVSKYQNSLKLARKDPKYIRDLTQYERVVDTSKVNDKLNALDTFLLNKSVEQNPVQGSRVKAGNRQGTNFVYNKVVDPKTQMENYGLMYDGDRDARYFIKQQYKDLFDQYPEEQAKALAIQDLASKRPISSARNQLVMDVKEDNWKEKALFKAALKAATGKYGDEAATYRQNQIDDIWSERNSASGVGNAVERLKAVVEANPLFDGANVNTMIRDTGRWINISVPERKVGYTTTDPEGNEITRYRKQDPYKVTIDKNNPDDKLKLNRVFDALTGEKVSDSKLQTGNAGGKIKTTIFSEQGNTKQLPKSVTTKFKNVPKGGF